MAKLLYKYMTLESLALILKSRKLRLNPLRKMDDMQEVETADEFQYANYVFISSWMDQPKEVIPMWKLYSTTYNGIRLGMKENPFKKYILTKSDFEKHLSDTTVAGESMDTVVPIEQYFNDGYIILNPQFDKILNDVVYTDDENLLKPVSVKAQGDKFDVFTGQVGKYKSTYWQFQNEKRYILRFIPINGLDKVNSPQISTFVYNKLKSNDNDFLDYFDLTLDDEAFNSMEVTMSPQFTEGNRILLELLKEKYNPNMIIQESALKDKIIL